jgi:hypothetical protein
MATVNITGVSYARNNTGLNGRRVKDLTLSLSNLQSLALNDLHQGHVAANTKLADGSPVSVGGPERSIAWLLEQLSTAIGL